jgi:hypothetical protein
MGFSFRAFPLRRAFVPSGPDDLPDVAFRRVPTGFPRPGLDRSARLQGFALCADSPPSSTGLTAHEGRCPPGFSDRPLGNSPGPRPVAFASAPLVGFAFRCLRNRSLGFAGWPPFRVSTTNRSARLSRDCRPFWSSCAFSSNRRFDLALGSSSWFHPVGAIQLPGSRDDGSTETRDLPEPCGPGFRPGARSGS